MLNRYNNKYKICNSNNLKRKLGLFSSVPGIVASGIGAATKHSMPVMTESWHKAVTSGACYGPTLELCLLLCPGTTRDRTDINCCVFVLLNH